MSDIFFAGFMVVSISVVGVAISSTVTKSSVRVDFERCILTSIGQKPEANNPIALNAVSKDDVYRCIKLQSLVGDQFR